MDMSLENVEAEDVEQLSISIKLAEEDLKCAFLAFAFEEAKRKCSILQSGQRRSIFHYPTARRTSTQQINGTNFSQNKDVCESMPSEKVLNEIKLDRELESLIDIFNIAVQSTKQHHQHQQEIQVKMKWEKLHNAIKQLRQNEGEIEQMEQALKAKKCKMKELRVKMELRREKFQERTQQQDEKINALRYNLRNVRQLNDLEYDLVQKWEDNRFSQAQIVSANAERMLQEQIEHYKQLLTAEGCRFGSTQKYLGLQMEEYKATIAQWQQKYGRELARCEAENQAQEQRIFELSKLHERQRLVYEQRVQYVEAYMAQKAEEQQLLMQEMRRIQSAVHIQAWWRGTMVRRGFGPYRKKAKKSKKGKGK